MFDKAQLHEQLKQVAKDAIFEQEFDKAVQRELNLRKARADQVYNQHAIEQERDLRGIEYPKPFVVEGDDQHKTQKWNLLLKESAFYFDDPTIP